MTFGSDRIFSEPGRVRFSQVELYENPEDEPIGRMLLENEHNPFLGKTPFHVALEEIVNLTAANGNMLHRMNFEQQQKAMKDVSDLAVNALGTWPKGPE